jgi:hypothetical protein
LFTERLFIEMLRFYRTLAQAAPQDWLNIKYLDQFQYFPTGKGLNVPVLYARAAKELAAEGSNTDVSSAEFQIDKKLGSASLTKIVELTDTVSGNTFAVSVDLT